jgi:hypothetical protein
MMRRYRSMLLSLLSARVSRAAATTVPEGDAGKEPGAQTASPLSFRVGLVPSPLKMELCLVSGQRTETVFLMGMVR